MKTKLIAIGVVSVVALTGLWFVALWSPQGAKLKTAQADRQVAEQKLTQLRNRLAHLKKLEANGAVLAADRDKLAAALPDGDQLDQFILAMNEKANASGVQFVSVAPAEPTAAGGPGTPAPAAAGPVTIGLQIQVTGDYFAILRFLESMRVDGERLVTVENLTMNKPPADNQPMTAGITGKMFVNRPVPAAAPASATVPATQTASTPR